MHYSSKINWLYGDGALRGGGRETLTAPTSALEIRSDAAKRASLPRRFRVPEKVSKTSPVWYNFNSRQMTLSISNFNNLKSPLRWPSKHGRRRFSSLFPGA